MPLPKIGTKEWDEEVKLYQASDMEWRINRAKQLGYSSKDSYGTQMEKHGIHLQRPNVPTPEDVKPPEPEPIFLPYPKFKIKPFSIGKVQRDEEDIGIVLADGHAGKRQ